MILVAAVLQALLIFFLGDKSQVIPRSTGSTVAFTLVSDIPPGSPIAELLGVGDPTLFALPDVRNFSGRAWQLSRPIVRPSFSWTEPERWLTQSVADLGNTLEEFTRKNRLRYRTFDEKLPPVVSRITAPPVPLAARSTVRIDGTGDRLVRVTPEIPSIPNADVLADTVIRVGIAPSGSTFSAVVLSGSGSGTADQLALDTARSTRFEPVAGHNPPRLNWAVFTFRWHTIAPPATNTASTATPP